MRHINKNKDSGQKLNNFIKATFIGASCFMLLTGCSNTMANYSGVEPQNRNKVEMVRFPYSMKFETGKADLSKMEIVKLNNFLGASNITYGNEFSMDFPLDRNGNINALDQERLNYVSNLLKESGLYMSSTVTPFGMEPPVNTGRLIVTKYVVTLPECGWSQVSYPNPQNAPLTNLGCSTQANLGLMIANPRDLINGQKGGPYNAERAAFAIERYQNRVVTVEAATATEN